MRRGDARCFTWNIPVIADFLLESGYVRKIAAIRPAMFHVERSWLQVSVSPTTYQALCSTWNRTLLVREFARPLFHVERPCIQLSGQATASPAHCSTWNRIPLKRKSSRPLFHVEPNPATARNELFHVERPGEPLNRAPLLNDTKSSECCGN
jgi:hypothetical protein